LKRGVLEEKKGAGFWSMSIIVEERERANSKMRSDKKKGKKGKKPRKEKGRTGTFVCGTLGRSSNERRKTEGLQTRYLGGGGCTESVS